MLLIYIKSLNDLEEAETDLELLENPNFHLKVTKKLKCIINRHCDLKKFQSAYNEKIRPFLFLYSLAGGIFGISVIFLLMSFKDSVSTYFRLILVVAITFWVFVSVIASGQKVENLSESIFQELCSLNWYNWNQENKKMYLILLSNSLKTIRMELTPHIAVNWKLGISIVKSVFSILSVLKSFT